MAPVGQGGRLLFCSENYVNAITGDPDPLRPDLLGLTQGARDVGLFYSRTDGHGAPVYP